MNVYTYTQARQNLATLLDQALRDGEVLIRRRDGQVFVLKPQPPRGSPLAVEGIDLKWHEFTRIVSRKFVPFV